MNDIAGNPSVHVVERIRWPHGRRARLLTDQRELMLRICNDTPEHDDPEHAWVRVHLAAEWNPVDSRCRH